MKDVQLIKRLTDNKPVINNFIFYLSENGIINVWLRISVFCFLFSLKFGLVNFGTLDRREFLMAHTRVWTHCAVMLWKSVSEFSHKLCCNCFDLCQETVDTGFGSATLILTQVAGVTGGGENQGQSNLENLSRGQKFKHQKTLQSHQRRGKREEYRWWSDEEQKAAHGLKHTARVRNNRTHQADEDNRRTGENWFSPRLSKHLPLLFTWPKILLYSCNIQTFLAWTANSLSIFEQIFLVDYDYFRHKWETSNKVEISGNKKVILRTTNSSVSTSDIGNLRNTNNIFITKCMRHSELQEKHDTNKELRTGKDFTTFCQYGFTISDKSMFIQ